MFAPKRSAEDWAVIDRLKVWARSEAMKAEMAPHLQAWSQKHAVGDARINIRELAVSTGYAELDRLQGTIVADGTIWLELGNDAGSRTALRLSTELHLEFGDEPDAIPKLVGASIEPMAAAVEWPADPVG